MVDFEEMWRCKCGNLNTYYSYKCARCGKSKSEGEEEIVLRCRYCGNCIPWSMWGTPSTCPLCGR